MAATAPSANASSACENPSWAARSGRRAPSCPTPDATATWWRRPAAAAAAAGEGAAAPAGDAKAAPAGDAKAAAAPGDKKAAPAAGDKKGVAAAAADKKGVAAHLMKHQGDFKGKSLTNFRAKALDADGLPSADDIRGAIHFALQGVEIDGMASPPCDCMGPSVTEVYPTDYPNGHAICGYRMADGSYEYAQFDYTYDEDGVTIDGDIVPVNLSWIPEDPEKEVGQGEEKIAPDATSTLIAAIASLQKSFETTMAHNLELAASAAKVAAPAPEPAKIEEPTVQAVTPAPVSVDIIGAGGDLKAAVLEAIRGMDIKAVVREGMAIELAKIKGQVDA